MIRRVNGKTALSMLPGKRVRKAWVQRISEEIYCDRKSKKGRVAREASVGRGKCQKESASVPGLVSVRVEAETPMHQCGYW